MKVTGYKSDYRLFWRIALTLFPASWFLPVMGDKGHSTQIGDLVWMINDCRESHTTFGRLFERICDDLIFSTLVSCLLAWLIQCAVVIIRAKVRENREFWAEVIEIREIAAAARAARHLAPPARRCVAGRRFQRPIGWGWD